MTFHSLIDLSSEPEASVVESGPHAMVDMPAICPSSVCSCLPVLASHILIVPSEEQLAMRLPSGENFTAETPFLCPLRISVGLYCSSVGLSGGAHCCSASESDLSWRKVLL